jgi:DNA-binding GntR family transcriptional regulator
LPRLDRRIVVADGLFGDRGSRYLVTEARQVARVAAPLRKQVVELLREVLLAGEFEPGERLVEAPLCKRFGVSRTVVREAIRQLESEGLVVTVANRGPVVAELSTEDARALYEVRASLEGLAGSLFAQRASDAQRRRLRGALATVTAAFEQSDLRKRVAAKDAFYEALLAGAGNPIIGSTLRGIHARVQLLRGLSLQADGRASESLGGRAAIVDATNAGDADRARVACEKHVDRAAAVAMSMLVDRTQQAPAR